MDQEAPTRQHQWLKQLIGDWTIAGIMNCAPAEGSEEPPSGMTSAGRESVRALGEYWVVATSVASMGGADSSMECIIQLGFDPKLNRFRGSWIGSPMTKLYVYDGTLDPTERILTLESVGPSFLDATKEVLYRDIIEIVDPATRLFYSQVRNDDGTWTEFIRSRYKRV